MTNCIIMYTADIPTSWYFELFNFWIKQYPHHYYANAINV